MLKTCVHYLPVLLPCLNRAGKELNFFFFTIPSLWKIFAIFTWNENVHFIEPLLDMQQSTEIISPMDYMTVSAISLTTRNAPELHRYFLHTLSSSTEPQWLSVHMSSACNSFCNVPLR